MLRGTPTTNIVKITSYAIFILIIIAMNICNERRKINY